MDTKQEKVLEEEVSAFLTLAVALRLGNTIPADPNKATQQMQSTCLEVWNVFQDFQAGVYAGTEANSGSIWADPTSPKTGGGSAPVAPPAQQFATLGKALLAALAQLPQSGSIAQAAAQTAVQTAFAGTGAPGFVLSSLLGLIPANTTDWSQVIQALQGAFANATPVTGQQPAVTPSKITPTV